MILTKKTMASHGSRRARPPRHATSQLAVCRVCTRSPLRNCGWFTHKAESLHYIHLRTRIVQGQACSYRPDTDTSMMTNSSANEGYWTKARPEGEFRKSTAREVGYLPTVLPVAALLCWQLHSEWVYLCCRQSMLERQVPVMTVKCPSHRTGVKAQMPVRQPYA